MIRSMIRPASRLACLVAGLGLIGFAASAATRAAEGPPPVPATVADGAQLVAVFGDDRFFEGPVWDPKTKKLYFTAFADAGGVRNQQILRLDGPNQAHV